jgi:hypothetical protein
LYSQQQKQLNAINTFFLINQKMLPIHTHGRKEKTGSVLDTWGSRLSSIHAFIHPSIYRFIHPSNSVLHPSVHPQPSLHARYPSIHIHFYPTTYPSIYIQTIYPSMYIHLFICICLHPSTS